MSEAESNRHECHDMFFGRFFGWLIWCWEQGDWMGLGRGEMKVIIELHRLGKPSRSFAETLISDDGHHVHTRTELDFDFKPPWMAGEQSARIVEKHLFYEQSVSIMELRNAEGTLIGHYCDIVDGLRRDQDHYHLRDLILDLWVPAEGRAVELDRDEFIGALASGLITHDESATAEAALVKLIVAVDSGRFPLDYMKPG